MFAIPHQSEKSRLRAICFWLMEGPRSVSLSENFDDDWFDRSCFVSAFAPAERIGRSVKLFSSNNSRTVARYLEWSHGDDADAFPTIRREFLLPDQRGIDRLNDTVARAIALTPFHAKSNAPGEEDSIESREVAQVQNIRVERICKLGIQRWGFGARCSNVNHAPIDLLDCWDNGLTGKRLELLSVKERFDADPFVSGLELDYDDYKSLCATFELPIELS